MSEDFYINLIQKRLSGEIDSEETKQLDGWLEADPGHGLLAEQIEQAWELSGHSKQEPDLDLDVDFAQLEAKIADDQSEAKVVPMRRPRYWRGIAIAASVFIIAVCSILFLPRTGIIGKAVVATSTLDRKQVSLADGTIVWLNGDSKLEYSKDFGRENRRVELTGEAFFDVTQNPDQPFEIIMPSGTVTVLGTSFNVRDYANEPDAEVQVKTGRVKFKSNQSEAHLVLNPGEAGVLNKAKNALKMIPNASPNNLAWQSKVLSFTSIPLSEVLELVEGVYGVEILLENEDLADCTITANFSEEEVTRVLYILGRILDMSYKEVNPREYQLTGGRCE